MCVKDLPEDIKQVVILRTREFRTEHDTSDEDILESELSELFFFAITPEKYDIWSSVDNGNFAPFYEFHQKEENIIMKATPYFDNISELLCNNKSVTKISELAAPFKEIAENYRKTLGDDPNEDNLALAFPFEETEEGESAWNTVYVKGNYAKLMLKQLELFTKNKMT